jgi:hypothetical protein
VIPFHQKYTEIDHPYEGRKGSGVLQRFCKLIEDCKYRRVWKYSQTGFPEIYHLIFPDGGQAKSIFREGLFLVFQQGYIRY